MYVEYLKYKPEDFGKRSVLRNVKIADPLQRAGYIERMGTGIRRISELCSENGTPAPEYEFTGFFFGHLHSHHGSHHISNDW